MVIFEMLAGGIPWNGLQVGQIVAAVFLERRRPELPPATNQVESDLQELAKQCWSHDAGSRPSFESIIPDLQRIDEVASSDPRYA